MFLHTLLQEAHLNYNLLRTPINMKVLIVGTGLSGCALARFLKDKGHDVSMIEKENQIGGLCITKVNEDGLKYEPFGARTFHTSNVAISEFVQRFDQFNGYIHKKGMIINKKLYPFPLTLNSIKGFKKRNLILEELKYRPVEIDQTNFETACQSIFGKTLYGYFIGNYSKKMWGVEPKLLTAEWAPKRLELREDDNEELFRNQWQGLPIHGYTFFLEQMIKDVPVRLNETQYDSNKFDVVATCAPLDEMLNYKYGKLGYRSIHFDYKKDEPWEKMEYGTLNLPQHKKYFRKCNFNVLYKHNARNNYIQYQQAVEADGLKNPAMYPVNTRQHNEIFDKYLKTVCRSKNICPLGRLGLFKYLDMDKAIECAFDIVPLIENYARLSETERYLQIKAIREKR
ncbi:MAG: hypothetical protein EHM79_06020 [Geobacter sp.]|nr:MAG: hypothetical protein EHM79_06020 [Geobacter sp.]